MTDNDVEQHVSQGEPRPVFDYEGKQPYMRTNYSPEALLKRYKIRLIELAAPRPSPNRTRDDASLSGVCRSE